jgi:hypothetical protein
LELQKGRESKFANGEDTKVLFFSPTIDKKEQQFMILNILIII